MKILIYLFAGSLLLVLSLLLLVYASTPWLARTQLPLFAAEQGFELEQIELEYPGVQGLNISSLILVVPGYRVKANGLQLTYDLFSLMHKRVTSATLEELVIREIPSSEGTTKASYSAPETLALANPANLWQQKQKVPFDRLRVRQFKLISTGFLAGGSISIGPEEISGELEAVQEGFRSRLVVSQYSSHQASMTLNVTMPDTAEKVLQLNAQVTAAAQAPVVDGDFQMNWNGSLPEPWDRIRLTMNMSGKFGYTDGVLSAQMAPAMPMKIQAPEISEVEIFGKHLEKELEIRTDLSMQLNLEPSTVRRIRADGNVVVSGRGEDLELSLVVNQISASLSKAFEPESVSFVIAAGEASPSQIHLRNIEDSSFQAEKVELELEESTSLGWSSAHQVVTLAGGQLKVNAPSVKWGNSTFQPYPIAVVLETAQFSGIAAAPSIETLLHAKAQLFNKNRNIALPIELTLGLDKMAGNLNLTRDFNVMEPLIGSFLKNWREEFDMDSGAVSVDTGIHWSSDFQFSGSGNLALQDAALHYQDIPVTGVNVELPFEFSPEMQVIRSTPLRIHAIDLGFPVTELSALLNLQNHTLELQDLHARVFKGSAVVRELTYDLTHSRSQFNLELSGLQLAELLQLAGGDVTGDGVIDGKLAVQYSGDSIQIPQGKVWARAPGGQLHYTAEDSAVEFAHQSGFEFALTALDDFHYQTLEADVLLDPQGDLVLSITLLGSNPKVQNGRAIRYNLNVKQNIMDLLKSLRMSGEFSSRVEKQLISH